MPNRYEREIEEILSRMEEAEPRRGIGDRIRPLQRPPVRARPRARLRLPRPEVWMLVSIALAMIAAGLAYYFSGARLVSGIVGVLAFIFFVVALVAGWRGRFRPQQTATWRGSPYVEMRPAWHNPFGAIVGQIRIWRLRRQYRRSQRSDGPR